MQIGASHADDTECPGGAKVLGLFCRGDWSHALEFDSVHSMWFWTLKLHRIYLLRCFDIFYTYCSCAILVK